jgi:hypothetical protein
MRRATWLLVALGLACGAGCGGTDRANAPSAGTVVSEFTDLDWAHGQYFLIYDPNFGTYYDIDDNSIRVYRDDANAGNNFEVKPGLAMIDPDGALQLPLSSEQETTSVRGEFNILTPGPGEDYEILHNVYAFHDTVFKVIRLRQPIPTGTNQTLAVSYTARPIVGPGHALGPPIAVGGRIIDTAGADSGAIVLKLLRLPRQLQTPTLDGLHFDSNAPLAVVRELELKSFYNLGQFNIDPSTFTLSVRLGQTDPPVTSSNGIPFIEVFGLDSWNESSSIPVHGHDGHVDATGYNTQTRGWIDYTNGVLFLPDARPFAPRFDAAHPFDRFLGAQPSRRLRLGDPGTANLQGEDIYELFNPRLLDAQWYFEARFAPPPVTGAKH